ncbi:RNA polymerase sigma-70 factor, partial [Bacteroidota bacterium]
GLLFYAKKIVKEIESAEEIVQDVFMNLWEKRKAPGIHTSLKSYLFRAVHNHALNKIKHNQVELKYQDYYINLYKSYSKDIAGGTPEPFVKEKIQESISKLPEQCRRIFVLSRIDGLKHKEIAEKLAISPKTVEVQIRKASILLREKLKDYYLC